MPSQAAPSEASLPRVFVLDEDTPYDVFYVQNEHESNGHSIVRVQSPFLFEIGEELAVRIEQDGVTTDARATVRAHVGPADSRITELAISDRTPARVVGG